MAERAARLAAESEAHHRRGGSTLRSGLDDIRAWHADSKNKGGEARLGDHRCARTGPEAYRQQATLQS
jgi:hypothetical protein